MLITKTPNKMEKKKYKNINILSKNMHPRKRKS